MDASTTVIELDANPEAEEDPLLGALDGVEGIAVGDFLTIGAERVVVTEVDEGADTVTIERPLIAELEEDPPEVEEGDPDPKENLVHASGDSVSRPSVQTVPDSETGTVTVERGIGRTDPAAHEAGTEVFAPPSPNPDAAVVEQSCGNFNRGGGDSEGPATTATPRIVADNIAWDTAVLNVPSGQEITLTVDNQDEGVAHNIHISVGPDPGGEDVALTDIEDGPVIQTVTFGPLDPGEYYYLCDVHPQMEGILNAIDAAAATPAADGAETDAAATPEP
jgi:plastocyanin